MEILRAGNYNGTIDYERQKTCYHLSARSSREEKTWITKKQVWILKQVMNLLS